MMNQTIIGFEDSVLAVCGVGIFVYDVPFPSSSE